MIPIEGHGLGLVLLGELLQFEGASELPMGRFDPKGFHVSNSFAICRNH